LIVAFLFRQSRFSDSVDSLPYSCRTSGASISASLMVTGSLSQRALSVSPSLTAMTKHKTALDNGT
jgi:hypothetical protein